jgi:hypothetical protein
VATGRIVPIVRAVGHLASTTVTGFFAALGLFAGYLTAFAFLAIAVLKPIFPNNVGVQYVRGFPVGLGAHFPLEPGMELHGGYLVIPVALVCGLGIFVLTQRGAQKFLSWWRNRRVS